MPCVAMLSSAGADLRLSERRTKANSESGGLGEQPQKLKDYRLFGF